MAWFTQHPRRLEHERLAIASLLEEGWVTSASWSVNPEAQSVHVDVDFEAGGKRRESRLEYPFIYPFAPPRLTPRDSSQRWSNHQWGRGGELCLQIRADNWVTSFNGADIVRSAKHLLDTEGALDEAGHQGAVPSEHQFTEGQLLRFEDHRLVLSDALIAEVLRRKSGVWVLDLRATFFQHSTVLIAHGISGSTTHERWIDPSIPATVGFPSRDFGRIATLANEEARTQALISRDMSCEDRWAAFSDMPFDEAGIIVGVFDGRISAKFLAKDHECLDITQIHMDKQQRAPTRNDVLAGKRVAILGCGSMGSKVAISLARMGVGSFLLVDSDLLKVGNLVRNELDWRGVGAHKVDAMEEMLKLVNAQVKVDRWMNHLGGQTSIETLVSCLQSLGKCDLIIETTGSGEGFTYANSVSVSEAVPMVWGRVFGGGFGGYIARSRPGIEASPLDLREAITRWLHNPSFPKPPADAAIDYAAGPDDQPPMIADDADVSVLSAHLTQFAADALRSAHPDSDYPYSAYVIGLRQEWIFEQPFDTRPIDLSNIKINSHTDDGSAVSSARREQSSL